MLISRISFFNMQSAHLTVLITTMVGKLQAEKKKIKTWKFHPIHTP